MPPTPFDTPIERRSTDSAKWNYFEPDVLPLWVADMDFRSPEPVIDALKARTEHGIFGYQGDAPALRETLVERLRERHHFTIAAEQIAFLPGLVEGLNLVSHIMAGEGAGVLTLTPIYPPFLGVPKNNDQLLVGAEMMTTRAADGTLRYEIDFDAFETAITPETRIFLFCNPHNPVGRVYTRAELERLADICLRHDLIICADEIHCDLVYPGYEHISIAALSPEVAARTVTLLAPSKTFNLAGIGLGVAVAPTPEIAARMLAHQRSHGAIVNVFGFTAALAAYQHGQPWLDELLPYLQANCDYAIEVVQAHLPEIGITRPEGTYLGWLDCRALMASLGETRTPQQFFIEEARVGFNDGAMFGKGGEGFVRVNYGCTRATLTEALERIRAAVERRRVAPAASTS